MKAMTSNPIIHTLLLALGFAAAEPAFARTGSAVGAVEQAELQAENQVKNLLEPLLDKYCRDQCKLMNVKASVDIAVPDEVSPGFDEVDPKGAARLAPASARVKILMDDKVGPISRRRLLDLVQQYLDTLDFPVKIDTQMATFPQPLGAAGKIAELREKVSKQFKSTLQTLFTQFCPDQCLLADFDLQTEAVNAEEAQYGAANEFYEDGGVAIRVKNIAGTLLLDETLTPGEQLNILEMARLKTNDFRNVSLEAKPLRFPRPGTEAPIAGVNGRALGGLGPLYGQGGRELASEKNSKESSESKFNRLDKNESQNNSQTNNSSRNEHDSRTSQNSTDSKNNTSNSNESNQRQERFERIEKIERVESGDAVQAELQKFKVYGLVFACAVLSLLIFVAMSTMRPRMASAMPPIVQRAMRGFGRDSSEDDAHAGSSPAGRASVSEGGAPDNPASGRVGQVVARYEIERLTEELLSVFAQQPKVAKQVFSRILTEEGVETTAQYIDIFGESIVMDMLRDPSLQADLNELMEFYAKNPMDIPDDERLDLLKRLHNRTVAGKLVILGSRSSHQFDFLADMDGLQILELVRNESLTVKAIILTQCDNQKRGAIYSQVDEDTRMKLLAELSRIDYLPRDFIYNVASALKRKRQENPRLNTEALPGSDVLINLLERSTPDMQMSLVRNLERTNPDSARVVKNKLVSMGTLRYLRDNQLLEVVLSLRHDELLQFLKGASEETRGVIISKSPKDLAGELEDELAQVPQVSRESYAVLERKVLNRMKLMANDGLINLAETNERMFADANGAGAYGQTSTGAIPPPSGEAKRASGW